MSALTEFRRNFADELSRRCVELRTWASGTSRSRNIVELSTVPKPTVLYVKEFNVPHRPGFWGLTKNQVDRLERSSTRWFAVLLLRSASAGYVLTCAEVQRLIADGSIELSGDGDYKVNEGFDLAATQRFASLAELADRAL